MDIRGWVWGPNPYIYVERNLSHRLVANRVYGENWEILSSGVAHPTGICGFAIILRLFGFHPVIAGMNVNDEGNG